VGRQLPALDGHSALPHSAPSSDRPLAPGAPEWWQSPADPAAAAASSQSGLHKHQGAGRCPAAPLAARRRPLAAHLRPKVRVLLAPQVGHDELDVLAVTLADPGAGRWAFPGKPAGCQGSVQAWVKAGAPLWARAAPLARPRPECVPAARSDGRLPPHLWSGHWQVRGRFPVSGWVARRTWGTRKERRGVGLGSSHAGARPRYSTGVTGLAALTWRQRAARAVTRRSWLERGAAIGRRHRSTSSTRPPFSRATHHVVVLGGAQNNEGRRRAPV
jgi:hypothetical protein